MATVNHTDDGHNYKDVTLHNVDARFNDDGNVVLRMPCRTWADSALQTLALDYDLTDAHARDVAQAIADAHVKQWIAHVVTDQRR